MEPNNNEKKATPDSAVGDASTEPLKNEPTPERAEEYKRRQAEQAEQAVEPQGR